MGEHEGEPLASIGEIARQHGDIHEIVRGRAPSLIDDLRDDVAHLVSARPYSATLAALTIGFFGGLSIALGRRGRRYSRGW